MPSDLPAALADVRTLLLDAEHLVRAVAAGRRRGVEAPAAERVEVRPVALRSGPHLQLVSRTGPVVSTRNAPLGEEAAAAVDELLAQPFGNLHVETATEVVQLRVTKKGEAQLHRSATSRRGVEPAGPQAHDRPKQRLVDPEDPLFRVLGAGGDKRRQVDAFVRQLAPLAPRALEAGPERELRAVDLGCGNAYLTFAAHRWLAGRAAQDGRTLRTVGVDVRDDVVARSRGLAEEAELGGLAFATGTIAAAEPFDGEAPDVVLALHACDTATDEALARAVRWQAPVVLAAPCCHHDVQRQIVEGTGGPAAAGPLVRHAILRERFADVLTDALRSLVLQLLGYRVEVVEFVDSRHTPRNALLRAVRTGSAPRPELLAEFDELTAAWGVEPALARMLAPELAAVRTGLGATA
ncbi:class I SAM-dependent methyltransferase [Kineococcus rubinsiae]|uniref:class I SAM-dependent methyltransferase n=1 Tax=Kineococcus rubinsiae TaxID=2609562 RepID=UPI0014321969|nr:SAM-dependent methyltransferase [Kineococcus rubinsiae]NIZ92807.1 SAM-dependent methyltransferase [Kineococcus rubinsiae]